MKYKIAIFDLDGTLLNTLEDLKNSLNYALNNFGYPVRTLDEVRRFVGNGIRKLIERSVPDSLTESEILNVYNKFTEHYSEHCADSTKPYNGIIDMLQLLRKKGIKTAVVSNKADYAVQSLCKNYFDGLFDAIAGEKVGIRKKPFPDSVKSILTTLKIKNNDAVYIGDSDVDIQTAKNSETDCIIVDWGFRDRCFLIEAGAKTIVSTANQLQQLIIG